MFCTIPRLPTIAHAIENVTYGHRKRFSDIVQFIRDCPPSSKVRVLTKGTRNGVLPYFIISFNP